MIGPAFDPGAAGRLYHHGPEVVPLLELIVGGGLPLAAALVLGRWRSVSSTARRWFGGTQKPPE